MASLKRPYASGTTTLSSKTYLRTLRSGKVQKIVREVYLRKDIPCLSQLCSDCRDLVANTRHAHSPVLSATPAGTEQYPQGHYLVPDTNAFLSSMDLLENEGTVLQDVIVLQTVLEEVKNRSLPLYYRLVALTKVESKRFAIFFNEFHVDTYVRRDPGETINDRNDRAIRTATAWYAQHLLEAVHKRGSQRCPAVVMLSDDRDNLRKAQAEQIPAVAIRDYVSKLPNADRLLDMIVGRDVQDKKAAMLYPDHLHMSALLTGVRNGTLHQGTFSVSPYNYLEGSVSVPTFERPLIVQGRENGNRAISGDVVIIEVLPKSQWKAPSSKVVTEEDVGRNENADEDEAETIVTEEERRALQEEVKKTHRRGAEGEVKPTAKVVGIIKRNWRQYVGHIERDSVRSPDSRAQQTVFFLPMDKRIPKVRVRTRQAGELLGKRVLVTIDDWDRTSRHPIGHFVRSLGELESKGAETEALLLEWDVQYRPFPMTVLSCLPKEGHSWIVPPKDDPAWQGREDLRHLPVCSIDPPGCVDIDDALHARHLDNGNLEVGVHIADVSHFVKPNTAMDREAALRGTTVYLVDKRIDMLPMLLGTDLCSLKPQVERYAFSVIWELNPDGEVIKTKFHKSVIRSREAFSYEAAQLRIDDKSQKDELTGGMRNLLMLSKKLRARRMAAGALNLASPEVRVQMESETSEPVDVQTKALLETNSLVEEFMLLANISVAAKNQETFPQTAVLRRHAAPPQANFEDLKQQLSVRKGLELRTESSKALADSLDKCIDPKDDYFNTLVRMLATRCMMSAEYFCAGTRTEGEFQHYGLATPIYTHFTSPIRRYADIEAHRQLAAAIGYEQIDPSLQSRAQLEAICANINVRHRNAQMAGRASVEYFVGQTLKGRELEEKAYVMRLFSNGLIAFVPRFGIEGLIRIDGDYDEEAHTVTFDGKTVGLFDPVKVKIGDEMVGGKRRIRLKLC
ncbi:ribonuclease R [Piedraia hortae CBS 480.64]|uniref:Ribosomal RNA-processing protein 44 n=1 Tax=Piedraia hortae CBS 480.64 TaxID=1314780 RepID=A0A6A7C5S2_9PEZI|nr:ribonuclease R [Piedraia hortae CBS 480.64]